MVITWVKEVKRIGSRVRIKMPKIGFPVLKTVLAGALGLVLGLST
jgi:hypothetical protein